MYEEMLEILTNIRTLNMNISVGQLLALYGWFPWRLQSIHHNTGVISSVGLCYWGGRVIGRDGLSGVVQLLPFDWQWGRAGIHSTVKVQLPRLIDHHRGWDRDHWFICNQSTSQGTDVWVRKLILKKFTTEIMTNREHWLWIEHML